MTFLTTILEFLKEPGLLFSLTLIVIVLLVSLPLKLSIERDLILSTLRGFIQLILVGFALLGIFSIKKGWIVVLTLLAMLLLASSIARKRGRGIPHVFYILFFSLLVATGLTLTLLVLGKAVPPTAIYLIPLGGMLIGNSMNGASLTLNRLKAEISLRKDEILVYLSLGASPYQSVHKILQETLKASLIPAIDSMKALGVIFMPGMMAGLIIAGKSPLLAVRYQIIVMFMLLAAASITNLLVLFLGYRQFFTPQLQLRPFCLRN